MLSGCSHIEIFVTKSVMHPSKNSAELVTKNWRLTVECLLLHYLMVSISVLTTVDTDVIVHTLCSMYPTPPTPPFPVTMLLR